MNGLLKRIDFQLVIPVLVLVGISLVTIFSINGDLFRNQLVFFFLSIGIFLFFTYTDFSMLESLSKPIYIVSLLGLFFLLFLGFEARGAARWLDIFGFRLQFSEVFKPFLAISLSSYIATHRKSLSAISWLCLLLFPIAFLIYKQPDLGSALIYVLSVALTLILFGYPLWWFVALGVGLTALIPLIFRFLHEYQRVRLLTFFHITSDPLGSSYNAIQAVIAVGSGMLLGKGLGQGTQSGLRFLPERHTDFIFATISEDLGFIGGLVILCAFGFLLYRLYKAARAADAMPEKVFLTATFSLLFIQCFVNIGMNIGLLPIVGVPLPFVSYGGSSLLSNAVFLGIASAISSSRRDKPTLEIR